MSHQFADDNDTAAIRQDFRRFDCRPTHWTQAWFGDPAAVHRGVGLCLISRPDFGAIICRSGTQLHQSGES
jgi:hypothetical protein